MSRTKQHRKELPDDFVEFSNEVKQQKEDFEEFKEAYIERVIFMIKSGYNLAQIAEISAFSYATLRNWIKEEVKVA